MTGTNYSDGRHQRLSCVYAVLTEGSALTGYCFSCRAKTASKSRRWCPAGIFCTQRVSRHAETIVPRVVVPTLKGIRCSHCFSTDVAVTPHRLPVSRALSVVYTLESGSSAAWTARMQARRSSRMEHARSRQGWKQTLERQRRETLAARQESEVVRVKYLVCKWSGVIHRLTPH